MESEMSSVQPSFGAAFSDTCVLLDFVLKQDDGSAEELLKDHQAENVISRTVEREFEGVKKRRERIVKSVLKAHKRDNLDNWEPPQSIDLSPNDQTYCGELFSDLRDMRSDSGVLKFLSEKERQLRQGKDELFDEPDAVIDTVWNGDRSVTLLGSLRRCVTNGNDRKVICDAADWADQNGTNMLVSSDNDDIISARGRIEELIERDRNVSQLKILTKEEFLNRDNPNGN
jgi:predicted nucleic acid-binding protein